MRVGLEGELHDALIPFSIFSCLLFSANMQRDRTYSPPISFLPFFYVVGNSYMHVG